MNQPQTSTAAFASHSSFILVVETFFFLVAIILQHLSFHESTMRYPVEIKFANVEPSFLQDLWQQKFSDSHINLFLLKPFLEPILGSPIFFEVKP